MDSFAVLFDIDGLMLDSERMARVAWTRALAEKGYQLSESDYLRMIGRTVGDARSILTEIFGSSLPFDQVFLQRQTYYDADIAANGIPVKPGLLHLLDFLEQRQIPKAVASSTPCGFATRKLALVGIDQRFLKIICGDMVSRGKPFPDLFLEAACQIGFLPEQCVVFEDSEAGIQAAYDAGMVPVMVPDLKPPTQETAAMAYQVIPSLSEAIPLLEDFIQHGLPQDWSHRRF